MKVEWISNANLSLLSTPPQGSIKWETILRSSTDSPSGWLHLPQVKKSCGWPESSLPLSLEVSLSLLQWGLCSFQPASLRFLQYFLSEKEALPFLSIIFLLSFMYRRICYLSKCLQLWTILRLKKMDLRDSYTISIRMKFTTHHFLCLHLLCESSANSTLRPKQPQPIRRPIAP